MARSSDGTVEVHQMQSVHDRVRLIGKQIDLSQKDPYVRKVAYDIVKYVPQHGAHAEQAEIQAVFDWVKENIQYRQEARDYDIYAVARRTLEARAGDCDDHCILTNGLLGHLGFLTGAKVISPDNMNWHIYSTVGFPKLQPYQIVPLDTTQPNSFSGWEPSLMQRNREILATFSGGDTYFDEIR